MGRVFNTSGDCKPALHYMVDLHDRLMKIKAMVDRGDYFSINRPRQYGKTTVLKALRPLLQNDYVVISMDFQKEMSDAKFRNENVFALAFASAFLRAIRGEEKDERLKAALDDFKEMLVNHGDKMELVELFRYLSYFCQISEKPMVLIIDEADSATDNQVFWDFLAQLRGYYISRDEQAAFQSVILSGVYDVKYSKRKIRPEEEHKMNSPWNIAVDFMVDMSFSVQDIAGMIEEYAQEQGLVIAVNEISGMLYEYTSGYPFLVSRICKLIDERIAGSREYPNKETAWTKAGVKEAIKCLQTEKNTLFESLINKLTDYPELRELIYSLLFTGRDIPYHSLTVSIEIAAMFGFVKENQGNVAIANRIFETVLYHWFIAQEALHSKIYKAALQNKNQFIEQGKLNMDLVLQKFVVHFSDLYGDQPESFLEDVGRRYFLLYLKPIINGTGNYYIESRTRNLERTDVIVDYRGEQFVIEMKVWRGHAYHERGEKQLIEYLEYYHLEKGYMLSFNFNQKKKIGVRTIYLEGKTLVEAVV